MKYCIANWKAHKTWNEALLWTDSFLTLLSREEKILTLLNEDKLTIILCPPASFLSGLFPKLKDKKNIHLCAQNISLLERGKHTGEITAEGVSELAQFVLIGHSERRTLNHETDSEVEIKYRLAEKYSLRPILCLEKETDWIPESAAIVAYEPPTSIGSGANEDLSAVLAMKEKLSLSKQTSFLYGGSVNEDNTNQYMKSGMIDGLLVGTASLDPRSFMAILKHF